MEKKMNKEKWKVRKIKIMKCCNLNKKNIKCIMMEVRIKKKKKEKILKKRMEKSKKLKEKYKMEKMEYMEI
jgi:hypothetical protein